MPQRFAAVKDDGGGERERGRVPPGKLW